MGIDWEFYLGIDEGKYDSEHIQEAYDDLIPDEDPLEEDNYYNQHDSSDHYTIEDDNFIEKDIYDIDENINDDAENYNITEEEYYKIFEDDKNEKVIDNEFVEPTKDTQ